MGTAKTWNREIDFQCSFGWRPFQKTLNISAKGFEWCGKQIPLKEIKRLRWGVQQTRGGLLPKHRYIAVFGTAAKEYVIKTKQPDFYEHLIERYWKAVGKRLLNEMLDGLAQGRACVFDSFLVSDTGVSVGGKKLFGVSRTDFYKWNTLTWGVVNGALCVTERENKANQLASLSFLWVDNVHVLYAALKLFEQAQSQERISKVPRI